MENKKVIIVICIFILILGLILGIIIGININKSNKNSNNESIVEDNMVTTDTNTTNTVTTENILNQEARMKTSLAVTMSTEEKEQLKATVEQDEANYGNEYQKITDYRTAHKREPDRIYFKSPKVEGFYKFEKNDKDYKHLLEVSEDRMAYSVMEDYNLYCFTPDSISTMMISGENYIIFDYDNKENTDFQKPLVFRFNTNTRLFRLATYLSCDKDLILVEDLGKEEFATNTQVSGYKYITEVDEIDN